MSWEAWWRLLLPLPRLCSGGEGPVPNRASPDWVSVSFKQVGDPLLPAATIALFCCLDAFAKPFGQWEAPPAPLRAPGQENWQALPRPDAAQHGAAPHLRLQGLQAFLALGSGLIK